MSGHGYVPRYTHVATTRRQWSREEKRAIVAELDAPGGSVSEVARRHGICINDASAWISGHRCQRPSVAAAFSAASASARANGIEVITQSPRHPDWSRGRATADVVTLVTCACQGRCSLIHPRPLIIDDVGKRINAEAAARRCARSQPPWVPAHFVRCRRQNGRVGSVPSST